MIWPTAKRSSECTNHCTARRKPLVGLFDRNGNFEDASASHARDKLLKPFILEPEIRRLATPVLKQQLYAAVIDPYRIESQLCRCQGRFIEEQC
ncbi:hypothetical protein [Bradyrhizobium sp. B117]|uniref:hypothetical protein n=1 Tax=Bradyrhizobium sp. B117 TaxID=3140246 RepID=UPI003184100D